MSTGPRTPAGKDRSSKNAVKHGLRAVSPVLPGEDPAEWEAHLAGIRDALAPADALEDHLVTRAALALWRLRRCSAYEDLVVALGIAKVTQDIRNEDALNEHVELDIEALQAKAARLQHGEVLRLLRRLPNLPNDTCLRSEIACSAMEEIESGLPDAIELDLDDDQFLADLGVPEDKRGRDDEWGRNRGYEWNGWTVRMVRSGLELVAAAGNLTPDELLARSIKQLCERYSSDRRSRHIKLREQEQRQLRMLPDTPTMDKLLRYDAHWSRQLFKTLEALDRRKAARAGKDVSPLVGPESTGETMGSPEAVPEVAVIPEPPGIDPNIF
jgi:hypothetical protein